MIYVYLLEPEWIVTTNENNFILTLDGKQTKFQMLAINLRSQETLYQPQTEVDIFCHDKRTIYRRNQRVLKSKRLDAAIYQEWVSEEIVRPKKKVIYLNPQEWRVLHDVTKHMKEVERLPSDQYTLEQRLREFLNQ